MPRPTKFRRVCSLPHAREFRCMGSRTEPVVLTVDEYEALRLIDYEELSQEQCAAFMQVARATVQLIYASARRKIAGALVEGCSLQINGGRYSLCEGKGHCPKGGCTRGSYCKMPHPGQNEPPCKK